MAADLRLTKIDELIRRDHVRLQPDDECYFVREYTSGAGFAHSDTNDLILNFKKSVSKRATAEWKHKERAIARIADELAEVLNPDFLTSVTLVPMPPSKARGDADHDDRVHQVLRELADRTLRRVGAGRRVDVRELLVQRVSTTPLHTTTARRDPRAIADNLDVNQACRLPAPRRIAVFDDIVTTGAHFRAATVTLRAAYPGVTVIGIFVARRVFPESEQT